MNNTEKDTCLDLLRAEFDRIDKDYKERCLKLDRWYSFILWTLAAFTTGVFVMPLIPLLTNNFCK